MQKLIIINFINIQIRNPYLYIFLAIFQTIINIISILFI